MQNKKVQQIESLLAAAAWCRSQVMNDCELELAESPRWKYFRARLLKIFGSTHGLEKMILEVMEADKDMGGDHV